MTVVGVRLGVAQWIAPYFDGGGFCFGVGCGMIGFCQ